MAHNLKRTPYELLGVSPDDDPAVIRRAWHAMVRAYHPDLAKEDRKEANRRLAEINAAFDAVWGDVAANTAAPNNETERKHSAEFFAQRQREKRAADAKRRAKMRAANAPTPPRHKTKKKETPAPTAAVVVEMSSKQPVMTEGQLALFKFLSGLRTLNTAPYAPKHRVSL